MELSILLMEQIAKLFIMIFMGYVVVKMGLLKDEDSKVLSTLVLYLIVPCVILNAFQVDYTPEKVSGLELACIASLLLLFILLPVVNLIGKVLKLNEVETMSIYYSNSGNLIGMLIGGMDLKKVLTNKKAYFISFMRLIVIPLIALLILKVSGLVGWNKEGEEILLIVFMAVISPVASTVTQMCQVYDNDSRYASTISVLTTLGAIVTMPLMVLVFQMVM